MNGDGLRLGRLGVLLLVGGRVVGGVLAGGRLGFGRFCRGQPLEDGGVEAAGLRGRGGIVAFQADLRRGGFSGGFRRDPALQVRQQGG